MLRNAMKEMAEAYAEATKGEFCYDTTHRVKYLMAEYFPKVETVDDISRMFQTYFERDKDKAEIWDGIFDGLNIETQKFCTDIALTTLEVVGLITDKQAKEFFKELFPEEKGE